MNDQDVTSPSVGRSGKGFTLLEMALVVALIGLIVGGGILAVSPIVLQANINQTNASMDQIESALVLFTIRNNRLPCPADGSNAGSSTNYGLEQITAPAPAVGTAETCAVAVTNAVIPWKTLGIDERYSLDGWGTRISYIPANSALVAGTQSLIDANGNDCMMRNTSTVNRNTICDIATTGLTSTYPYGNYIAIYSIAVSAIAATCSTELTLPNTNNTTATAFNGTSDTCISVTPSPAAVQSSGANAPFDGGRAAYVLISHGQSTWYGWNKGGNQIKPPATTYTLKVYNDNGSAGTATNLGFVQGQGSTVRSSTAFFDDIVRWRSPAYVIQQCGSGGCGNP